MGVGQRDGRGELAGLADPFQTGELAVAVEPVGPGEDRLGEDARVRDHDGDAGVHRVGAGALDRVMPDGHSSDIGDGVVRTGRVFADDDADVAGART